jgi:chorismate lyase / 3-hydroxybenzoate synthase
MNTNSRLEISLSEDIEAPSPEHQLLVAFYFGETPAPHQHDAIVCPNLAPLDREFLYECWWYKGDVAFSQYESIRIAECDDYTIAIFQKDELADEDYRAFTCRAYSELLQAIQSTQHTKLAKAWNYIGGINQGDDDHEKYRQFSVGRTEAFIEFGIGDDVAPTGTAIGTARGKGLSVIALASRQDLHLAENPRQVSAFRYPRQYGPSSPMFSRGGFVSTDNHKLYLISGTAAVVGHESAHPFDVAPQADETLKNLAVICDAIAENEIDGAKLQLDGDSIFRVYLRDPKDFDSVVKTIGGALGHNDVNSVYLQGNICRRELMVEVDAAKAI